MARKGEEKAEERKEVLRGRQLRNGDLASDPVRG